MLYRLTDDGLLEAFEPWPHERVRVRCTPDGVQLVSPTGDETSLLPWDLYLSPSPRLRRHRNRDGWDVTFTDPSHRHVPSGGVSVRMHGALRKQLRGFRTRTTPWSSRVKMALEPAMTIRSTSPGVHRIPISTRGLPPNWAPHPIEIFSHLSWVLRDCPQLRPGLAEPERMQRLVDDLRASKMTTPDSIGGPSQQAAHVRRAMRYLGRDHRFRRPIRAGDTLPHDDVVDAVLERLATSSDPKVLSIGRSWVSEVVRITYTDVEPWPFASLVD